MGALDIMLGSVDSELCERAQQSEEVFKSANRPLFGNHVPVVAIEPKYLGVN